jgi:hypothetical protein
MIIVWRRRRQGIRRQQRRHRLQPAGHERNRKKMPGRNISRNWTMLVIALADSSVLAQAAMT